MAIIYKELSEIYQAGIERRSPRLADLPIQYIDFSVWQRKGNQEDHFKDKFKFWNNYLRGYTHLNFPIDKVRPARFSYRGDDLYFSIEKNLSKSVIEYARKKGVTLYIVLLMVFNILLSRYTGQEDIVIGSPIANRYHKDIESLVGFLLIW